MRFAAHCGVHTSGLRRTSLHPQVARLWKRLHSTCAHNESRTASKDARRLANPALTDEACAS